MAQSWAMLLGAICPLAAAGGTLQVTVVNRFPSVNQGCRAIKGRSITLFSPGKIDMSEGSEHTLHLTAGPWQGFMFGVQENSWYWREGADWTGKKTKSYNGAPETMMNPDNAGMQVTVNAADCSVTTAPSWSDHFAPPRAQDVIDIHFQKTGDHQCTLTLHQKQASLLCVTEKCCAPFGAGMCTSPGNPAHCSASHDGIAPVQRWAAAAPVPGAATFWPKALPDLATAALAVFACMAMVIAGQRAFRMRSSSARAALMEGADAAVQAEQVAEE
eukprot:CAMPEP_0197883258 /NCGR_PEP_ID=MMETSP1439-20131203/10145_1 /TAXON_ID=66791 /ORGANISM="Gonyaulax spinifera, Strain CCMP409" /LENGTH=272 /DNA_ID=CAMNT_0043502973 /DNA_START=60 /DNA_END=878 /DNA_ORIENTATION=+